ncbi:hypothetical protein MMC10_002801 [Thelotrema lepadinum]|nr:hypothetical protein [Thelotrema lepadinum]
MNPTLQKTTQRLEETSAESTSRHDQGFKGVESALRATDAGLRVPTDKTLTTSRPTTSIVPGYAFLTHYLHSIRSYLPPLSTQLVDNLSSYLGRSNPFAYPVHHELDSVWLLDNTAFRPAPNSPHHRKRHSREQDQWHAEFTACFFERDSGKDVSRWVAEIADKVGLHDMDISDEEGVKRISERVRPFLAHIRPARWVDVVTEGERGGHLIRRLGPGGRSAVSSQVLGPIQGHFQEGDVANTKSLHPGVCPLGEMRTYFADPEGWMVVSDIDDTIKITQTPSPVGILRTTFVSDPETTPGLPELYSTLDKVLKKPAWFYLSASPYNLYPFLRPFLHAHYPRGTMLLRETSWITPSGLLTTLTQGVEAFKLSRLEKLHEWFPHRRVLCVGDSTQSDPEAFGEAYRRWPGWVKGIFIRKVTGLSGMEEKNKEERFEKAFEGVKRSAWTVFEGTGELGQAVEGLKSV